jgi:3-hydroxybutyrate dehydrogenase
MKLENKIASVSGAASGIGKPMACWYAAEGARVAIADLKLEAAEAGRRTGGHRGHHHGGR